MFIRDHVPVPAGLLWNTPHPPLSPQRPSLVRGPHPQNWARTAASERVPLQEHREAAGDAQAVGTRLPTPPTGSGEAVAAGEAVLSWSSQRGSQAAGCQLQGTRRMGRRK